MQKHSTAFACSPNDQLQVPVETLYLYEHCTISQHPHSLIMLAALIRVGHNEDTCNGKNRHYKANLKIRHYMYLTIWQAKLHVSVSQPCLKKHILINKLMGTAPECVSPEWLLTPFWCFIYFLNLLCRITSGYVEAIVSQYICF